MSRSNSVLRSKLYWIGVLYFAQGFPAGVFYEILPVDFRQRGIELSEIGLLSLLGLAWTIKFLWAPLVSRLRHYRLWMFGADVAMAVAAGLLAAYLEFGAWVWVTVGFFTLLSATNDIAIDGYTIEFLKKDEMGLANGMRIGFYRVGLLTAGGLLTMQGFIGWPGVYAGVAVVLVVAGMMCRLAPPERPYVAPHGISLLEELRGIAATPFAFAAVVLMLLGVVWIIDVSAGLSAGRPRFWPIALGIGAAAIALESLARRSFGSGGDRQVDLRQGPMFGAFLDMLQRPHMLLVMLFILLFKLADTSMGFMIKPFWVDAGFTPAQIGLVSVNVGIALSVTGGLVGGWVTDRIGIFNGLWVLGLTQAFSNLGYAFVASVLPTGIDGLSPDAQQQMLMYGASAIESFTQGLGTAAFLAFLMAIVDKRRSATEYALLSALFILSRSVAGWAGGLGAEQFGYASFFLLTFFLAFPAYLLLPWVKRMLAYAETRPDWHQE